TGRCPLKGGVAVMIRLVDFVDQRWALAGSSSLLAMANGAIGVEFRLACLQLGRETVGTDPGGGLRRITGRQCGKQAREHADLDGRLKQPTHRHGCGPDLRSLAPGPWN